MGGVEGKMVNELQSAATASTGASADALSSQPARQAERPVRKDRLPAAPTSSLHYCQIVTML
jgi:hypothetical protein